MILVILGAHQVPNQDVEDGAALSGEAVSAAEFSQAVSDDNAAGAAGLAEVVVGEVPDEQRDHPHGLDGPVHLRAHLLGTFARRERAQQAKDAHPFEARPANVESSERALPQVEEARVDATRMWVTRCRV